MGRKLLAFDGENFTIYLTSNEAGRTTTLQVRRSWLRAAAVFSSIFAVLLIGVLFDYVGLLMQRPEHERVKTEYQFLISNLQFVESELNSLEDQLGKVKKLTEKIEVIQEYFSQGPIAAMATPTEYFSVDYVATEDLRKPSSTEDTPRRVFLVKSNDLLPSPLIDEMSRSEDLVMDKMSDRIELAVQKTQATERKVMQLWENLSERQNFIRATPSVRPARGWFSSRFGIRADPFTGRPTMHSGLDIAARYGTPVYSTADGVVTYVGYQNGYGNIVTVDHGYGIQTRYAHNAKVYAKVGQKVRRYDVISAIGSSGRSTGSHVHYEVRVRGIAVDPINYILDF